MLANTLTRTRAPIIPTPPRPRCHQTKILGDACHVPNVTGAGTLNHLGVEVESTDQVQTAITRLQGEGMDTLVEENATCCFAVQDKVWVDGPDAEKWEIYTVLSDAPVWKITPAAQGECCA